MNKLTPFDCVSIIKKHYPMLDESDIKQNKDGLNCLVFIIKDEMVFRFPINDESRESIIREINFLSTFSSVSPVRVPHLQKHDDPSGILYCTYKFIKGETFRDDWAKDFTSESRLTIARQLGDFLSVLHGFSLVEASELGLKERDILSESQIALEKTEKDVFSLISDYERKWIEELYITFFALIRQDTYSSRVCHYDFMPKHFLIDREHQKLNGIIDFGEVSIGDPANDFTFFDIYGNDFLEEAYKCYSLQRDSNFGERRQFYKTRHIITDLRAAINTNDRDRIVQSKKTLAEYIDGRSV